MDETGPHTKLPLSTDPNMRTNDKQETKETVENKINTQSGGRATFPRSLVWVKYLEPHGERSAFNATLLSYLRQHAWAHPTDSVVTYWIARRKGKRYDKLRQLIFFLCVGKTHNKPQVIVGLRS